MLIFRFIAEAYCLTVFRAILRIILEQSATRACVSAWKVWTNDKSASCFMKLIYKLNISRALQGHFTFYLSLDYFTGMEMLSFSLSSGKKWLSKFYTSWYYYHLSIRFSPCFIYILTPLWIVFPYFHHLIQCLRSIAWYILFSIRMFSRIGCRDCLLFCS